jgi:hypothetical protein
VKRSGARYERSSCCARSADGGDVALRDHLDELTDLRNTVS